MVIYWGMINFKFEKYLKNHQYKIDSFISSIYIHIKFYYIKNMYLKKYAKTFVSHSLELFICFINDLLPIRNLLSKQLIYSPLSLSSLQSIKNLSPFSRLHNIF